MPSPCHTSTETHTWCHYHVSCHTSPDPLIATTNSEQGTLPARLISRLLRFYRGVAPRIPSKQLTECLGAWGCGCLLRWRELAWRWDLRVIELERKGVWVEEEVCEYVYVCLLQWRESAWRWDLRVFELERKGVWVKEEVCVCACVCVFVAMTRVGVTMRSTGFWVGKEGRVSNRGSVCVCVCVFVAMTRVGVTMRSTGFWVGKEGCVSNRGSVCMCMCVCCDETSWWRDLRVGKEGRVSLRGSVCVWVGGWAGKKARVCE